MVTRTKFVAGNYIVHMYGVHPLPQRNDGVTYDSDKDDVPLVAALSQEIIKMRELLQAVKDAHTHHGLASIESLTAVEAIHMYINNLPR